MHSTEYDKNNFVIQNSSDSNQIKTSPGIRKIEFALPFHIIQHASVCRRNLSVGGSFWQSLALVCLVWKYSLSFLGRYN